MQHLPLISSPLRQSALVAMLAVSAATATWAQTPNVGLDPAVAAFDHLTLLPAAGEFTLLATPAGAGRVDVLVTSAAGVVQPSGESTPWWELGLLTLHENSSTAVSIVDLRLRAFYNEPADISPVSGRALAGSLTVGAVPTDAASRGGLKASFGDDR